MREGQKSVMCCCRNSSCIKKLIFIAVLGIFVFASCSLAASFVFISDTLFRDGQSSQYLKYVQIYIPYIPTSHSSDEENLPAALMPVCEALCSQGISNSRTRNKMLLSLAERFISLDHTSLYNPAILERSFYKSSNICAKNVISIKTTRKLE